MPPRPAAQQDSKTAGMHGHCDATKTQAMRIMEITGRGYLRQVLSNEVGLQHRAGLGVIGNQDQNVFTATFDGRWR